MSRKAHVRFWRQAGEGDFPRLASKRASKTSGVTTTSYLYDVSATLPMLLEDGSRKYVWGQGLAYAVDSLGSVEVQHADGLGSVRALTDANAQVVQTYQSDEFGVQTQSQGASGQPFEYTGEQRDDYIKLVYLRARVYDPQVGRFLQRGSFSGFDTDPLPLSGRSPSFPASQPARAVCLVAGRRGWPKCPLGRCVATEAS